MESEPHDFFNIFFRFRLFELHFLINFFLINEMCMPMFACSESSQITGNLIEQQKFVETQTFGLQVQSFSLSSYSTKMHI